MPAVSVRLLDLRLVLNIHLRISDYQLSSSLGRCFLYRRWGINSVKIAFDLLRAEMGSYKKTIACFSLCGSERNSYSAILRHLLLAAQRL